MSKYLEIFLFLSYSKCKKYLEVYTERSENREVLCKSVVSLKYCFSLLQDHFCLFIDDSQYYILSINAVCIYTT